MNFRSYTVTVDFEGLELPLPNNYRYITRDRFGFIQGWRNKPTDTEFGMSGGDELPITFGHQSSHDELKTVIRKYRRRGNTELIAITGAVEYARGEIEMKYEILDVTKLAENYAIYGWAVVCDGDTKRAYTAGTEEPEEYE